MVLAEEGDDEHEDLFHLQVVPLDDRVHFLVSVPLADTHAILCVVFLASAAEAVLEILSLDEETVYLVVEGGEVASVLVSFGS